MAEITVLDRKSVIEHLEMALKKAKAGELIEVTMVGRLKNGDSYFCCSGSYDAHKMAGIMLDMAISRLGYQFRINQ